MYRSLNSRQRDVAITCLLLANHSSNEWEWDGEIFTTQPGEFITSLEKLTEKCAGDVKVQSVRTALLKLEKWQFLTNTSTKTGRLIKIVNWPQYQMNEYDDNKAANKELTKHQQRANKELTTNKNDKNDKNDKKKTYKPMASVALTRYLSVFNDRFLRSFEPTLGREKKLQLRLKVFTIDQIMQALENLAMSPFHRGENDRGWSADPDFLIRTDEQVDKWLNSSPNMPLAVKPKDELTKLTEQIYGKV